MVNGLLWADLRGKGKDGILALPVTLRVARRELLTNPFFLGAINKKRVNQGQKTFL